jgi:diketogulonate reductase-like aldo/keto reductase
MSWYPVGHADLKLLNEKILKDLADKYNKTTAQIIIRWHMQKGFIVIPGSKNLEHIKENLDIYDIELSNKDMELISTIDINKRYYIRIKESLNKFKDLKPEYEKE